MAHDLPKPAFVSLRVAAVRLGVPASWLRAEVKSGRLPALVIGRRVLVDVEVLRGVLTKRLETREGSDA